MFVCSVCLIWFCSVLQAAGPKYVKVTIQKEKPSLTNSKLIIYLSLTRWQVLVKPKSLCVQMFCRLMFSCSSSQFLKVNTRGQHTPPAELSGGEIYCSLIKTGLASENIRSVVHFIVPLLLMVEEILWLHHRVEWTHNKHFKHLD